MCPAILTHFLPGLCEPGDLAGGTAVVIDVLRASTTICHALDAGARAVIPCVSVEEAESRAAELMHEGVVLGGERGGQLIDGFDLDNSPLAYTPDSVAEKTVIFTTTNGTRALLHCREAQRIFIGTFNNFSAVVSALLKTEQPVHLVCAGTEGKISQEDVLFAGAVVQGLYQEMYEEPGTVPFEENDETNIASEFFLLNCDEMVPDTLKESRGGRNLQKLNMTADIERAAEFDRFDFVPEYSNQTGRIVVRG